MGRYKINFSKRAVKQYKKLPKDYKVLIDLALNKLSDGTLTDMKPVMDEKTFIE